MSYRSVRTHLAAFAAVLLMTPGLLSTAAQSTDVPTNATLLLWMTGVVDSAVAGGDWATARSGWSDFDNMWDKVEDPFRDMSRDNYRDLEGHQRTIRGLLGESSPDADRIHSEISALNDILVWYGGSAN